MDGNTSTSLAARRSIAHQGDINLLLPSTRYCNLRPLPMPTVCLPETRRHQYSAYRFPILLAVWSDVQNTKAIAAFPAVYDELETHVAGLCASLAFVGEADPDTLGTAAHKRSIQEEVGKNPIVPADVTAANFLTCVKRDKSIERVHLLGPPLRASWFMLAYHAWALIAARCGRLALIRQLLAT